MLQAKQSLLKTKFHSTSALSSTTEAFNKECCKLRSILSNSIIKLVLNSTINMFIQIIVTKLGKKTNDRNMIRIVLPLKDLNSGGYLPSCFS